MLRYGRLSSSLFGHIQANVGRTCVVLTGLAIAGCSADIMRFDAPVLGLGSSASEEKPTPIHSDGSLFEQRPDVSTGLGPSSGYSGANQSNLNRVPPTRTADAGPLSDANNAYRPQPAQYAPSSRYQPSRVGAGSLPATRPMTPAGPAEQDAQTVIVRSGDTLYDLARRHGVTVRDIKQANGLSSNIIRPGQELRLSGGAGLQPRDPVSAPRFEPRPPSLPSASGRETYTVQPGDSLYAISRRTGVSVASLKRINNVRDVRRIRPGMVLQLREGAAQRTYDTAAERALTPRITDPNRVPPAPASALPSGPNEPIILNPRPSNRVGQPSRSQRTEAKRTADARPAPRHQAPAAKPQDGASPLATPGRFRWPLKGRIIRGFGKRPDGTRNEGINIAAPTGTQVHASEAGVVAYAGNELKGYGNLILVRHDDGFVTAYAHADRMLVRRGDNVRRGQVIARAGKTGTVKQPQLHFELRKGAKPINPIPYLGRM